MDYSDDDIRTAVDISRFARLNGIRCFTQLVVQLENNGLVEWAACAQRMSEHWTAYFEKWTRDACEGCRPDLSDLLSDVDWDS